MGKLGDLTTGAAESAPPRLIFNGVEGWGKTTTITYAPSPILLQASGERGYEALLKSGRVPEIPRTIIPSWPELLARIDWLIDAHEELGFRTVGLDALGGMERLCHEHVCATEFNGDWGERGFVGYQRGYRASVTEWIRLLQALDRLQEKTKAIVIFASHAQVRNFKNPTGPDYDRFVTDAHQETWAVTHRWADAVLFADFHIEVETRGKKDAKGKGTGGKHRIVYCERSAAWDAKNRYGMPEYIWMDTPDRNWSLIAQAIRGDYPDNGKETNDGSS